MLKSKLDTPFLWVDLDTMERNITYLSKYFEEAGVGWRPHTKGIKVPAIAHKMMDAGAIGVTCAKLSEAEVLANAGINEILIANQITSTAKMSRFAHLQRQANILVAVDNFHNAKTLSIVAEEVGVKIGILIEVNIGMNRCGILPGQPAIELAKRVSNLAGLQIMGVMGWEGHVVDLLDPKEKKETCSRAINALVDTAKMIRTEGLDIPIVSCGGSGSYKITSNIEGVTEIQAGGAVFGDITYENWGADTDCSLFIQASVISHPSPKRLIIDAGFKTMNWEVSKPKAKDVNDIKLIGLDAEHGYIELLQEDIPTRINDRIDLIVGYGDATVFLHDQLVGIRDGSVEVIWEIQGRGKLK